MLNLQIKHLPVETLIPYARNARTHSDEQVSQIAGSITEFGFVNPILIGEDSVIIAGHGRLMAAQRLGLPTVPVIMLAHLSETQRRALVLADNKIAENAGWDEKLLSLELLDLQEDHFDLSMIGFSDEEISDLLQNENTGQELTDPDDIPETPEDPVTVLGDIWLLGDHRVMCGDSTKIDDVENLLDGNSVDLVFTDPPYNVGFNGRSGKHGVIKNDDLPKAEFEAFIGKVCNVIRAVNPKAYYIWCNWNFYSALQGHLPYKACIVWAKNVFGLGNGYRHQHEFCLFNGKIDEVVKNESDLWEIKKDTNYVHPTQKPVALSVRAFGNHVKMLNVLDLFGGSGSTMIGAEQTGRKSFLMELDPKYCDVIVKRWQEFTGKKATLEKTGTFFDDMAAQKRM